jgi:AhpD family alkylhydroperoxidase
VKFSKRLYKKPGDFFSDLWSIFRNLNLLNEIMKNEVIPFAFRERLMLAVTSVNGCRYCSYFHTKQALKSGMDAQEIAQLLAGEFAGCSEGEAPAIIYAQHWAESNGHPDNEALHRIKQAYGPEKTVAINLILRMIRLGNMTGNTWDYLRYRLSFGGRTI